MGFFASLIAAIGADTNNFEKGVRRCELLAEKFAKNTVGEIAKIGAGYLTVNYALGLMSESMERAGNVKDLSERLGIDVELLQEFQFAAKQTGTDIDAFARSIQKLNMSRSEALADPKGEKASIFSRYGIGLKELQNMSGEDIFLKIGEAVKGVSNPQNELVFATEILGKTAAQVFPAMREGLHELATEAKNAGEVMEKDVIEKLDRANKKYDSAKNRVGNTLTKAAVWAVEKIEYAGSFWGAKFGGANEYEASKIAVQKEQDNLNEIQKKKAESAKNANTQFDASKSKSSSDKTTPTEWAYKAPSGDKLREIGGFTGAAQNAQLAYLEKIREATEKTAEATQKTATIVESDSGPIP